MASSFSLGGHFDAFVKEQLASGRYTNASEVLRAVIRVATVRPKPKRSPAFFSPLP
jgi:antitoxin ParD1/3/4